MDKYTIIIPTLWKSKRTEKLLKDLEECIFVDEIIVIDNKSIYEIDRTIGKIRLISKGENIYVNPAWNWGIELAKNECIALCNDDINFNPNIFGVLTKETLSKCGIIGQSQYNYGGNNTNEPIIEKWNGGGRDWGWGCLIIFDKKNWIKIPEEIKIWYGDDFIFKYNPITKCLLKNFNIETEMSTTSDESKWDDIKKQDYINFINY